MSDASKVPSSNVWTPANVVTLLRIFLVPVFFVVLIAPWPTWLLLMPELEYWKPLIAAVIFVILAATDGVDGFLARRRGEVTTFGQFIDPLADKMLVAAALLALVELGTLPSWPALLILAREFIVSGIRMLAATEGIVISASWYGKVKTVAQIVAITLFLVKDIVLSPITLKDTWNPLFVLAWVAMVIALVATIWSMLDYFSKARELFGFTQSKRAKAKAKTTDAQNLVAGASVVRLKTENERKAREVLEAARAAGVHLATAESLTGGLIASTLTSIPGSSDVVAGGVVSYHADAKESALGVEAASITAKGVVSREVACEMAEGAMRLFNVTIAVSATGIAGPGGAEPNKPVGTVWVGVATTTTTHAELYTFDGGREEVRLQTVGAALDSLKRSFGS